MRFRVAAWFVVCSLAATLVGCPSSSGGGDEDTGEPTFVDGFEDTSGLFVMLVDNSGSKAFNLLDPRTNTVSENQYPLAPHRPRSLAVSPDGTMLAHITPGDAVLVTRFVDDSGTPNLELVQSWEGLSPEPFTDLRWNTHSDRVYTGNWWLDVETGEAKPCDISSIEFVEQAIQSDGYHARCGGQMLTDGDVLISVDEPNAAAATTAPTSADGALITAGWRTDPVVISTTTTQASPPGSRYARSRPTWDATTLAADELIYGFELTQRSGNGVVTCQENTRTDKVAYSEVVRPHDVFLGEADYFDVNLWDFSGLEPFYGLPDSQVYTPLGAHPATGEFVYRVDIRRASGRDSAACQNLVVDSHLVAISTAGETRSFSSQETFGETLAPAVWRGLPWERPSPYAYDLVPYGDSFLLPEFEPDTSTPIRFVGFLDGEPRSIPGSMLDPEGRYAWGAEFVDDTAAICRRGITGGATQCIRAAAGGTPILVGGEGVMSGDDVGRLEVRHISHTARPPGALLTIHGQGFGNAGSLLLGDTEISSTAAALWTDRRIEIVVGGDWPERSVLRVKSGDQLSGEGGMDRWMRVTPATSTPLDGLPDTLELRQGLNRFDTDVEPGLDWISVPPTAEGTFWIQSYGADEPTESIYRFQTESWSRYVPQITLDDTTDTGWIPIREAADTPEVGFVEIAGEVVSRPGSFRPRIGENRIIFDRVFSTPADAPNPFGIPDHAVNVGSRTFSTDRLFGNQAVEITGWSGDLESLRADTRNVFDGVFVQFGQPRGIAGIGDLLLVSLIIRMGVDHGYGLSLDGGATFQPIVDGLSFFRAPVGIVTADGPAIFGILSEDAGSRPVFIDADGVRDAGVTIAAGAEQALVYDATIVSAGGVALWHVPGRGTSILDLNVAPEIRLLDLGSPIENLYHAASEQAVYVTLEDGRLLRSDFDGSTPDFQPVTFDIELADGTTMTADRVMQFSDGRSLVRASFDTSPIWTDSLGFWLVSPNERTD